MCIRARYIKYLDMKKKKKKSRETNYAIVDPSFLRRAARVPLQPVPPRANEKTTQSSESWEERTRYRGWLPFNRIDLASRV